MESQNENKIPEILPILPLADSVVFPAMLAPLQVVQDVMKKMVDEVIGTDRLLGLFFIKDHKEPPSLENLHAIGTAGGIGKMLKTPDGNMHILLQGLQRIRLVEIVQSEPYIKARVELVPESEDKDLASQGLSRNLVEQAQKIVTLSPGLPQELNMAIAGLGQVPSRLADMVAANLNISPAEKQQVLDELNVNERLKKVTFFVTRELEILETGHKIQDQIKSQMDKGQREYFLREQMKAIQKELGEVDEKTVEMNEIREKLKAAQLPPEAMKEAERELERLTKMPPQAAEYTVARSYLDWLAALPWNKSSTDNLDIAQAERILNEDHFDLEKVKKRILEYLSVRKLKHDMKGPILCFVGPPGVGKTSLGQSIARALGRKFVRFSLGGMRDEAEIRGHRRTYIGALPGRIIKEIRRAETNNPVFMLDEVDKIGMDFRGDPASALLEVLDPQQNNTFQDNYLDIAFDLSKVLWITTANVLHTIPAPLRDRMEIIEIAGYSEHDKLGIARKYLVPRQLKEHGIKAEMAEFTDEALADIIRSYTREAGIRNLEREIANIMRSIASGIARGGTQKAVITVEEVRKALGHKRFLSEEAFKEDEVGVTTGLAWTEVGGDILFVESSLNPGRGALILTGQLGNVMQESARAALTCARTYLRRTKYKLPKDFFNTTDIHVHVPAGAIPKDGPSAGITMAASLISAITGKPVRRDVAMTGEITLRGKVLPIGGVKEKVLAAHRAGIKKVILPEENRKDLEDVTKDVREAMSFDFVQTIDQVLKIALKEAKKGKAKR